MALKDCSDDELEAIAHWLGDFLINDRARLLLELMQTEAADNDARELMVKTEAGDAFGHCEALARQGFLTRHPDRGEHRAYSINYERIAAMKGPKGWRDPPQITLAEALDVARKFEERGELTVELTAREVLVRLHGEVHPGVRRRNMLAFRTPRAPTTR